MKFNKNVKISYIAFLIITSISLGTIFIGFSNENGYASQTPQTSSFSLDPVSILIYTEYADTTSLLNQEFANTLSAIDLFYGSNYIYNTLSDYTNLTESLFNYDVFLILEQERATISDMNSIGVAWESLLFEFIANGGILICLDFYSFVDNYYGISRLILHYSSIINFHSTDPQTGNMVYLNNKTDSLAWGIDASWVAPSETISAEVTEGTIVVEDMSGSPVVVHKTIGKGHAVYCGFDFYTIEENCGKLLANAIKLTRHVIFDDSHTNYYEIENELESFGTILVEAGFAVSTMKTFNIDYINASKILVLTYGTEIYSGSEIDVIEDYITEGNGILVCSDYKSAGNGLDGIIERFGFLRNKNDFLNDSNDYTDFKFWPILNGDNIKNHPITSGVSSMEFYATTAFSTIPLEAKPLISTDNDSTSIWHDSGLLAINLPIAVALGNSTTGRIVTVGDSTLLTSMTDSDNDGETNFFDASNDIFFINTIFWLYDPLTFQPNTLNDSITTNIPGFLLEYVFFTLLISFAILVSSNLKKKA